MRQRDDGMTALNEAQLHAMADRHFPLQSDANDHRMMRWMAKEILELRRKNARWLDDDMFNTSAPAPPQPTGSELESIRLRSQYIQHACKDAAEMRLEGAKIEELVRAAMAEDLRLRTALNKEIDALAASTASLSTKENAPGLEPIPPCGLHQPFIILRDGEWFIQSWSGSLLPLRMLDLAMVGHLRARHNHLGMPKVAGVTYDDDDEKEME